MAAGEPLEIGHGLKDLIAGQTDAGFLIADFFEDSYRADLDLLSRFVPSFIATRAVKL